MRGRGRNPNQNPGVRPVEKIELSEKTPKRRIVIAVLLLAVGLGFLGYAIFSALTPENGWAQIEPVSPSSESVAGELVFLYELGVSGRSVNAEHKELSVLYTELCMDAYRLLSVDYAYEGVHNLHYLNSHIGEEVVVEPGLFRALARIEQSGSRLLFAAPFYREYRNLFSATEDASAAALDPARDAETAAYFAALSVYTADEAHVSLELTGENTVRLQVSDAYRAFAAEQGIESFIDLYWARNAFAVDYVCEELIERGFHYGSISSYDGFVRVMDRREVGYSYNLYGLWENTLFNVARLDYIGARSTVLLRSYPMSEQDLTYYTYADGTRRHPYVDAADGYAKNATDALVAYSDDRGCAEVLLAMLPVYITDALDTDALVALAAEGVYTAYAEGAVLRYTQPDARLTSFYRDERVSFTGERVE